MASVSKNVSVQEPFLSDSANRSVNCSENLDGIIPFEFNSDERLFILPTDALGYQFPVTSLNTPSMASSIQNFYPPRETLDNSSPYSPAKSTENGLFTAFRPCSSTSDALPFSLEENVLQDNSTVHAKTQDISPSLSSPIISNSHNAAEASNSAILPVDTHSEQPRSSYSLQEAYSLVGAGLANLGNTCFMNSILQCMTHTTLLVQGLRTADHLQICQCGDEHFCLFCALHDHVELSLSSSGGVVLPHKLVDNLSYISSYFVKLEQEDAHEFLQCLLDKLGGPCLFVMENKRSLACESDGLVKRIFGGCLVSKLRCCNCGHLSDRIEPVTDLSLEIENVDSLSGALESFTSVEKIDDLEMRFTCENCREVVSIEKRLMLDQVPSVATFHLKRFKSDGIAVEKIDKPVKFPLELDLKPYTWSTCDSNVELRYELYAVVEHVGEASTSGHYISYVRPSPDSWFRLDDSKVTLVPENYVLSQEAYILFYAKKGTPWVCTLMEERKQRFGDSPSIALPMSVPDDSCRGESTTDNCNVDECTEFGCIVPSQSSSHPFSTHPSGAVEEFDNISGKNASRSGNEENEEHGKVDDSRDMDCFNILTPTGSPEPGPVTLEPQGHCIPQARAKPEKHANAERPRKRVGESSEKREAEGPLKKAMDSSEKREALRYVQRSMPSARGMRFVAAMLENPGEGTSGKAKKRMRTSPCNKSSGSPNTRRKLPHNSVAARFVAAGN